MKTTVKIFVVCALATLFGTTSCNKEIAPVEPSDKTITISIQGTIDDFTSADGVKATAEPVIRVAWAENDIVYVYDGIQKLGQLKVSLRDNDPRFAYLTNDGEIQAPAGSIITLVYSNTGEPVFAGGKLTVDLSNQNQADFPFVIYATLPASQTVTNQFVPFKFATSVMKINGTGIGTGSGITKATIAQVSTTCQIQVSSDADPVVSGVNPGTITRSANFSESSDGRATFTIGMAMTGTGSGRDVLINKAGKFYYSLFTQSQIKAGASYNSVFAFSKADFVKIGNLKWALNNLAISDSGKKAWKGGNSDAVKAPGTDEDVVVGDYFQWAAYAGYSGDASDADKGLLLYTAFTNKFCSGDASNSLTLKGGKQFVDGSAPYYNSGYTKYNSPTQTVLERTDDAANIILGGNWRMPTKADFVALKNATYWAWDGMDKGYYVFNPDAGHPAKAVVSSIPSDLNKADALLFFPETGICGNGELTTEYGGEYWASEVLLDNVMISWLMSINNNSVSYSGTGWRRVGRPIRPVSD